MQVLYQDLTGDVSTPDNEINKKTHERIKLMLDIQDPDIIIDLRKIIGEKGTNFDVFWNEMHDYFNEVIASNDNLGILYYKNIYTILKF